VRACDNSHYRGLIEVLRDKRRCRQPSYGPSSQDCGIANMGNSAAAPAIDLAMPHALQPVGPTTK
jgi:hypothetical protein